MKGPGPLLILSGPSGSGKSTVIQRLVASRDLPVRLSVSATTRLPRPGEQDGRDYYFWTHERFEEELRQGAFLEHALVHGNYYGTLCREVEPYRLQGLAVILDIDVQGAEQVRRQCPDQVSVFLRAPSTESYRERLEKRGTEDEATIQRRLSGALRELARAREFDYEVVNDDLDAAVDRLRSILQQQFERTEHVG